MGEIAYYCKDNNNYNKTKLYLNIVDKYKCTNKCIFCDKNRIENHVGSKLYLDKKPSLLEITSSIDNELKQNYPREIIFCGIVEPTIYFETLIETIKYIKNKYNIPVRLNTNGHAQLLYPERDIAKELKEAGLDIVSISFNATNTLDYNRLHNPFRDDAFDYVIRFAKDCNNIGIDTYISFIEFDDFDLDNVLSFARSLGFKDKQVKIRRIIG